MKIKKLEFVKIESQFQNFQCAKVPGISSQFFIWVDRESGKTKSSGIDGSHCFHNSVDEAKEYCEKKFIETIENLFDHEN